MLGPCVFKAVSASECPSNGNGDLPDCTISMNNNDLCEAEQTLPDGNSHFEVNNCPGDYDIFKCVKGNMLLQCIVIL